MIVEQNLCLLLSRLLLADQLFWDFFEPYLWIGGGISFKAKRFLTFLSASPSATPRPAPAGRIQGILLVRSYFVLSFLFGRLTIMIYSLGSGAHPFTCGLLVSQQWSIISLLWICDWCPWPRAPSYPLRKQEGWRDSAQVFFHSPCFLTLITFCCGKEMRRGLKNRSLSAS